MANTSYLFPVINTEKDSSGNIIGINYQNFLPQNNLQPFSSSVIPKNEEINLFTTDKQTNKHNTVYTKFDMGVSSSSYLRYKLKYYQHSLQNKSSYTNFILGNNNSFTIDIIDGGNNYTKKYYNIKIYTNVVSNNSSCWLCYSGDNSNCNECNKILDVPIYAKTLNGKIDSIEFFPYYIANNKLIDNTKLLYQRYTDLTMVIPTPETDIVNSMAILSLEINKTYQEKNNDIKPRESGLTSSVQLNYMKKHNRNDFNVTIKKKFNTKIRRFLYQQSMGQQKLQENYSILHKIDNYDFNPRIRFKKTTKQFIIDNNSKSLRGLSQSSLLSLTTSSVINNTRQVNINNTLSNNQYLKEKKIYNQKNKNK